MLRESEVLTRLSRAGLLESNNYDNDDDDNYYTDCCNYDSKHDHVCDPGSTGNGALTVVQVAEVKGQVGNMHLCTTDSSNNTTVFKRKCNFFKIIMLYLIIYSVVHVKVTHMVT